MGIGVLLQQLAEGGACDAGLVGIVHHDHTSSEDGQHILALGRGGPVHVGSGLRKKPGRRKVNTCGAVFSSSDSERVSRSTLPFALFPASGPAQPTLLAGSRGSRWSRDEMVRARFHESSAHVGKAVPRL